MSDTASNPPGIAAGEVAGQASPIDYAAPTTTSAPTEGFGTRSARGGMVMSAMLLAQAAINFASQIVLAWLLVPNDFGIAALAASVAALIAVLRDAGAPTILIQRQHEFDKIAGSVFWLTVSSATLCGLLVAASAPFVAQSKNLPILLPVLLLTALRFPIGALGTISQARLMIDLRWSALASVLFLQPLITATLAVLMAARGYGVYSLIVPAIFADATRAAAAWWLARVRAPLRPNWIIISTVIGSSVYIILTNLTLVVRGVGDYLTLSYTRSEHETGLYYYAFLMCQGLSKLSLGALPSVLGPVFSKVKHEPQRHAEIFTRSTHTFAALGVLPIVMQCVLAWPLFRVFLDPKWEPAATLFAIISLMTLACFVNLVFFQAMYASGFYKQFFLYSIIFTPVMVGLFIIGTYVAGATGVAWANVAAGALDFALFPILACALLKVPWAPVMSPLWRPLVAAAPAALCAWIINPFLPINRAGDIARILIVGSVGSACYAGILWLIWRPVLEALLAHVLRALGIRRP